MLGMETEGWESFVSAISAYSSAHPINNLAKTFILLFFKRRRRTKHDFSTHLPSSIIILLPVDKLLLGPIILHSSSGDIPVGSVSHPCRQFRTQGVKKELSLLKTPCPNLSGLDLTRNKCAFLNCWPSSSVCLSCLPLPPPPAPTPPHPTPPRLPPLLFSLC